MSSKVMTSEAREAQLRKIVGELAGKYGVNNVTRRMVAKAAKCSEPLVSAYLGTLDQLKIAAKREARKLGLKPPTGKEEAAIGAKLRAHKPGDKRDTRKRTVKEVRKIKETKPAGKRKVMRSAKSGEFVTKAAAAASPATTFADTVPTPTSKPKPRPQSPNPPERKPTAPPERKTAARAPKLPPIQPVTPTAVD